MTAALAIAALMLGACAGDEPSGGDPPESTTAPTTPATTPRTTTAPTAAFEGAAPDTGTGVTSTRPPDTAPRTTTSPAPQPSTTPAAPPDPRTERMEIVVAGVPRHYILHVPDGLPAGPAPLVLDLHGLTATADRQDRVSGMRSKSDEGGFVVAQPEAGLPANAWDTLRDSSDLAFIRAMVREIATVVEVDPNRVFAAGFSAGGGLAHRLACDADDLVAAIASVAGAHLGWSNCEPDRPVPVIAFHGDQDLVVPYDGFAFLPALEEWATFWSEADACDPRADVARAASDVETLRWTGCSQDTEVVLYRIEGGGHGWPGTDDPARVGDTTDSVDATDLIWEFFSAHPMPAR